MIKSVVIKFNLHFVLCILLLSPCALAEPKVQRPDEMEFDARVIQGQRAEGAVYLFQRSARPLPPLLNYKRDYLSAIVSPVFNRDTKLGQRIALKQQKQNLKIGQQNQQSSSTVTSQSKQKPSPKRKATTPKLRQKKTSRKKWQRSKRRRKK